jgi:hypothetical protein
MSERCVRPLGFRATLSRWRWVGALVISMVALNACQREPREPRLNYQSQSYYFTITSDPMPPRAREDIMYKIVMRDRETRQPIDAGEGMLYSSNRDDARTGGAIWRGPEIGTYYGRLRYVTSGEWAVAIEFRRDSTARLEKAEWMQEVLPERDQ